MRFRLFRMGIEGAIAVGNLSLLGIAMLVYLATSPPAGADYDSAGSGEFLVAYVMTRAVLVLTFPVGWLGWLVSYGELLTAVIFVPLNAYLWGYTVAAIVRPRKPRRPTCHKSDADVPLRERAD